jgi:hypothetical protein
MTNKESEGTGTMAIAVSQDDKIDNQPVIDSQPASFSQVVRIDKLNKQHFSFDVC